LFRRPHFLQTPDHRVGDPLRNRCSWGQEPVSRRAALCPEPGERASNHLDPGGDPEVCKHECSGELQYQPLGIGPERIAQGWESWILRYLALEKHLFGESHGP
jgi:hypothetical protein